MNLTSYRQRAALCAAAVLVLGSPAAAQAEDKAFAKQVNQAIDRGVEYLRKKQSPDGSWPRQQAHERTGATALAGLALLEGGVPPTDLAVSKAADVVRKDALTATYNYSVSLAIMFLDRLGDPQDIPLIESLAVRVLGGQNLRLPIHQGGWGYHCPRPSAAEVQRLQAVLQNRKPWAPPKG